MLKDKRFLIFDMDGTIYLGDTALPNAVNFIEKINADRRVIFFTNNASKNQDYYYAKLKKLGFPEDIQVLTSADVLIKFLKNHRRDKRVYLLGTLELESMFRREDINLSADNPDIVVSSFDTTLTYDRLERACTFIRNGAEWLTTHPDINCPIENGGYIPDCGAINALISVSTGEPLPKAFGKPHGEVIDMIEEIYAAKRENMAMFGDRLYTDIACGNRAGIDTALVLSGEGKRGDIDISLHKPTYVFEHIGEIFNN